jgi:hypothetical protein
MDLLEDIYRKLPVLVRRLVYLLTRKNTAALNDYMKRELYGMEAREQAVVSHVISMAGQVIAVRRDTVAINKKLRLRLLQEGDQLRISKKPIRFDKKRNIYIALLDNSYNNLAIKLSDYITDIHVSDQG